MAGQAKFEDSNIALFGSDVEKQVKLNAAKCEPEWKGAGSKVGVEAWRVEKFQIKRVPEKDVGRFYEGDSYIVLKTYRKPGVDKLFYNAHFWLGSKTTQDEAGTAAYKTVELDTLLKDVPVQFREVQSYETASFLGCFAHFQILQGGIDSGFNHVKPESYQARLLQFKGKRNIRVIQVPLQRASLNEGDVFLLDAGLNLWLWNGRASGVFEKRKGTELMNFLKVERDSKPVTATLDQGQDDDAAFWKMLGGKGAIASAVAGGDDAEAEAKRSNDVKLYRLNDQTGLTMAASGELALSQLDAMDVFILDSGISLFIWVGRGASRDERSKAMFKAMALMGQLKKPAFTPITRLVQGGENDEFLSYFPKGGVITNANVQNAVAGKAAGASASSAAANDSSCCVVL